MPSDTLTWPFKLVLPAGWLIPGSPEPDPDKLIPLTPETGFAYESVIVNKGYDGTLLPLLTWERRLWYFQASLSISVNTGNIAQITWSSVSPTTLQVGGNVSISGQAFDYLGNPVGNGKAITLSFKEGGETARRSIPTAVGHGVERLRRL